MLVMPDLPPIYRILAIDPGTDTMGVVLLDVDLQYLTVKLTYAETFRGDKMSRRYGDYAETYGDRAAKLYAHEQRLLSFVQAARPHCIISESPYMGRFPTAFQALVECLTMLQRVTYQYDPSLPLETVDPPTAKKAVGAPGKMKRGEDKKAPVRMGVLGLNLHNATGKDLSLLDEHSIDAIAVGYSKVLTVLNAMNGRW